MLVLSRKEAQRIRLGDSIVITVVRLSGDKVRLGIQAPKDMLVLRDELEPLTSEEKLELKKTNRPMSSADSTYQKKLPAAELGELARSA